MRWNQEEVDRQNAVIEERKENRRVIQVCAEMFRNDVIDCLLAEYELNTKREIAEIIFSKACEEGHSGGYFEVLSHAIVIADFVEDILTLAK